MTELPPALPEPPWFRVGFPKQIHIAPSVVMAPSVTVQISSAIALASSKIISTSFSCVPAKPSDFSFDQGTASAACVSGRSTM